jgi:type IV pilus assembly protein PilM
MISLLKRRRNGPIGVDIGARAIKLVQFSGDRSRLIDACRWELPALVENATVEQQMERLTSGLKQALEGRAFRGRDAVLCLNDRQLFLQNIRVKKDGADFGRQVAQEAASKVPFGLESAELRFVESADVRHGDSMLREVIVFACQRAVIDQALAIVDSAKLQPVAVDVEPAALVRSYAGQFRREDDRQQRALMVHVGYTRTAAVIAQGDDLLFVKYIEVGGSHFDAAVARHLKMDLAEAVSLRRHNGDRRADMQDPEVSRGVNDATRSVVERLAAELGMCVRYHSVTFRGQPITRMVLGGGEATQQLLDAVAKQLDIKCELSDPFRGFSTVPNAGRKGQWDVAAGLALREEN